MKIRNIIILTALSLAIFCLGSCGFIDNSDGQGSIIINLGGAGARYTVTEHDMEQMIYTITLTSPGKAAIKTKTSKGAKSVAIPVSEGAWNIQVKAEGDGNRVTKGEGAANAVVAAGKPAPVIVDMKVTGTRVHNFKELINDFKDTTLPNEYSIEIVEDIVADTITYKTGPVVINGKTITLWSEKNVTIKRKDNNKDRVEDTVFTVETGTLILDGTKGGTITIDGNSENVTTCERALINVAANGTLKMYDGVKLFNNKTDNGGGVHVSGVNAYFYMYGGTISYNFARTNGGGVYVTQKEGGTFIKTGGIIENTNSVGSNGSGKVVFDKGKIYNETLGETDNWPR